MIKSLARLWTEECRVGGLPFDPLFAEPAPSPVTKRLCCSASAGTATDRCHFIEAFARWDGVDRQRTESVPFGPRMERLVALAAAATCSE